MSKRIPRGNPQVGSGYPVIYPELPAYGFKYPIHSINTIDTLDNRLKRWAWRIAGVGIVGVLVVIVREVIR